MKIFVAIAACAPLAAALWPIPSSYTSGNTTLWIEDSVKITYSGANQTSSNSSSSSSGSVSSQMIDLAIARTRSSIFDTSFVPWKFHPRNSDFEPSTESKQCINSIKLVQTQASDANSTTPLDDVLDESYTLSVPTSGDVIITAPNTIGLVYGLTTFSQLFFKHTQGGSYTSLAPVQISDSPKFSHRGLNMDMARNWMPVDVVKKMMDALAFNKFNRFHMHITDAQSWPLEVPSVPELSAKGAYGTEFVYSADDLQDMQSYGQLLGLESFIEIDMPGHTSSIWFSHPELIAAFNIQPDWDNYCAEPPCGTLKLNDSAVGDFLDKVLGDVLPRSKPYSSYFHAGGDEVNPNAYLFDETVMSNDSAVIQPLMQKFVDRNHDQIRKAGLTPIAWEEMLLQWNLTLGDDVLIQTWQTDEAVAQSTAKGYKTLAGNYNYWYLDCGHGQWLNFYPGTSFETYYNSAAGPFADYCSPLKNWRLMYAYDPLQGVPADQQHLVVGGEAHIWAEQTDASNLDTIVWPRAAAAAEVLWSGAKDAEGGNRSQIDAAPRLSDLRERLVARGVRAQSIQMPFCTQNGTQCAL
ncbi:glycoside hydrolase family 20 protein [Saccharata proteae CBS 121410]|uniref:Beta-hexosaminidase n=1 Tax=Saccharata proteae CBS 121410 TaxID=1314787 RepID=A0A9P4HZG4_9PEZI|nr:glycoside hydrolase family 20 protein [Saccharata proteae CBS 121410]